MPAAQTLNIQHNSLLLVQWTELKLPKIHQIMMMNAYYIKCCWFSVFRFIILLSFKR